MALQAKFGQSKYTSDTSAFARLLQGGKLWFTTTQFRNSEGRQRRVMIGHRDILFFRFEPNQ